VITAKVSNIDAVMREVNNSYNKTVSAVAVDLHRELQEKTPVRTGTARAGWQTKKTKDNFEIVNRVPYVEYLDKGTTKMKPSNKGRGIIGPALNSIKGEYK
jgi:hypothetical protein